MVVLPSRLEIPNPMPVETMATTIDQRLKSGQTCRDTGTYEFDGYVDGSSNPLPSADDMRIILMTGDEFPMLGRLDRACYWRLFEDTRDDDPLGGAGAGFQE